MRQPLSNSDYLKYPMPNSNQWIDFGLETVTHRQMGHLSLYRLNRVNPQQPHISTHCKADAAHSRSSWSSCEKVKRQCSLSQKSLLNNRSSFLCLLGLRAQGEGVHTRATAAPPYIPRPWAYLKRRPRTRPQRPNPIDSPPTHFKLRYGVFESVSALHRFLFVFFIHPTFMKFGYFYELCINREMANSISSKNTKTST